MVSTDDAKKLAIAYNAFNGAINADRHSPHNLQHKKNIISSGQALARAQDATGIALYTRNAINRAILLAQSEKAEMV